MNKYLVLAFLLNFTTGVFAQKLSAKVYFVDYGLMPESAISEQQILTQSSVNYTGEELVELIEVLKDTLKFQPSKQLFLDHRALIDIYNSDRKIYRVSFSNFGSFLYNGIRYDMNCDVDKIAEKIIGVPFLNKDYCK